jgi:hypothetical protein
MKLNDLIDHANRYYPDDMVQQNWDYVKSQIRPARACADTLAVFVCNEIAATYNSFSSDEDQLHEAARAMQTATDELCWVAKGLKKLSEKMAIA